MNEAEIIVFEKGPFVSFANCGLPYYVGDTIKDREELLLQTPEKFWNRFRVKVHILHEVLAIQPSEKSVTVKNRITEEDFTESFDKLILAPGAGAIVPDLPGIQSRNIFTVKTVPDSDAIKSFLAEPSTHNRHHYWRGVHWPGNGGGIIEPRLGCDGGGHCPSYSSSL